MMKTEYESLSGPCTYNRQNIFP